MKLCRSARRGRKARSLWFPLAALTAAVCLTAPPVEAQAGGEIRVDGSSTVYPISAVVSEEFKAETGIDAAVSYSGTGAGFKKFARGEIDIAGASRPIKPAEHEACVEAGVAYIEVPVAYDGITLAIHKSNAHARQLTLAQLRKVFLKPAAQTWQEVDPSFPATRITCYTPGEVSGTYDLFLQIVAGKVDKATGRHEYGELRDDLSRNEDDNQLVHGVANNPGGIGFFGVAYYFANADRVDAVAIENPEGQFVLPTAETIETKEYAPFSRPLFLYVRADVLDRPEVAQYLEFYLNDAATFAEAVGYVGLPEAVYDAARRKVAHREPGTVYLDADNQPVEGPVTALYP
ncbi:MAG: PstS family phosphate ABC transporter substrate-binding protein [Planctomycetota bacterium]